MRLLAGLGGPWRPKKYTQTTTGLPYAAPWSLVREMRVFRSFKTGLAGVDLPAVSFLEFEAVDEAPT